MSQPAFVVLAVLVAFVIYVTARGELGLYLSYLT